VTQTHTHSFFERRQKTLLLLVTAYVIGLLVSHATLPTQHVWFIAAFFSIAMNYTYVQEAFGHADYFRTEAVVAGALIGLSLAGLLVSPLLIPCLLFTFMLGPVGLFLYLMLRKLTGKGGWSLVES